MRAIDSLLNQEEIDWECIVVDDGSNDNTFDVIKKVIESDNRFRYIYHQNKGLPLSRNVGLLASNGIFVTFLDSDDEYKIDHLSHRKSILIENENIKFLYGGVEIVGNQFVKDLENPNKLIHLKNCVIGGTFVIERNIAIEIGGFPNVNYGDDKLFFDKLLLENIENYQVQNPTYVYYRDTPDSICNNFNGNLDEK